MPDSFTKLVSNASQKAAAKPRPKRDAKARARAVYHDLQVLAEQEEAPLLLIDKEIKNRLNPGSYKQYIYIMRL
jgi:hypothetical protein